MGPDYDLLANLALALIASAYGRGEEQTGPDDPEIRAEARAINAIRQADWSAIARAYERLKQKQDADWEALERQYGRKA